MNTTKAEQVKMRAGKYLHPVTLEHDNGRVFFHFGYNPTLANEIKASFEGRKYHGFEETNPRKIWSAPIKDNEHNQFQLDFLTGKNPYAHFDTVPQKICLNRKEAREHQQLGIDFIVARRHCLVAAEMGLGKTFMSVETLEQLNIHDCWYVAPKSALASAKLDYMKWNARITPQFMTYEGFVKRIKEWNPKDPIPHGVIFDEASRLRTPTSKRSQCARYFAMHIRQNYGFDSLILGLSGSPSPKSLEDFWSLCEIFCPGYLKEGNLAQFRERYALMKTEDLGTGPFKKIVTWKDNDRKCGICGRPDEAKEHDTSYVDFEHIHVPMENEAAKLYGRMKGLVLVMMKKDCLDLPDKVYKIVNCEADVTILRSAQLIRKGAKTTLEALTRLRELSDGFQYKQIDGPKETCSTCHGNRFVMKAQHGETCWNNEANKNDENHHIVPCTCPESEEMCFICEGVGETRTFTRETIMLPSKKDEALEEILEDCEDSARLVIYAGFTASVERCKDTCIRKGWEVIRIDGRGCQSKFKDLVDAAAAFQDKTKYPENIAIVAHPESGGMGLTLTASHVIVYYSNDFKAENRIQSEDRIHRMGMDENKGATIIDLVCLPTDLLVLENLRKKRELQSIGLGELGEASLDTLEVKIR